MAAAASAAAAAAAAAEQQHHFHRNTRRAGGLKKSDPSFFLGPRCQTKAADVAPIWHRFYTGLEPVVSNKRWSGTKLAPTWHRLGTYLALVWPRFIADLALTWPRFSTEFWHDSEPNRHPLGTDLEPPRQALEGFFYPIHDLTWNSSSMSNRVGKLFIFSHESASSLITSWHRSRCPFALQEKKLHRQTCRIPANRSVGGGVRGVARVG